MKTGFWIFSATVLILSGCTRERAARIEVVGPAAVDFGRYPAEQKRAATYRIRNAGNAPLKIIRVRNACGCAATACPKSELKPGEETTIEVAILPDSIFGSYRKTTFVESNDPRNRVLPLDISGTAVPLVDIKPSAYLFVGRIPLGQPLLRTFDLQATRPGVTLGAPIAEANRPAEATLGPLNDRAGDLYRLEVRLPPVTESGDFQCAVKIPVLTPSNHPPVMVNLSGKSGVELIAVPGTFELPLSDAPIPRDFRLRILGPGTGSLTPESLVPPIQPGVTFQIWKRPGETDLSVAATFHPAFLRDLSSEREIRLSFGLPGVSSATVVCKARE